MIVRLYHASRRRRWERDRRRRIAEMLDLEGSADASVLDWLESMAAQLAEIRTLPEALYRSR